MQSHNLNKIVFLYCKSDHFYFQEIPFLYTSSNLISNYQRLIKQPPFYICLPLNNPFLLLHTNNKNNFTKNQPVPENSDPQRAIAACTSRTKSLPKTKCQTWNCTWSPCSSRDSYTTASQCTSLSSSSYSPTPSKSRNPLTLPQMCSCLCANWQICSSSLNRGATPSACANNALPTRFGRKCSESDPRSDFLLRSLFRNGSGKYSHRLFLSFSIHFLGTSFP